MLKNTYFTYKVKRIIVIVTTLIIFGLLYTFKNTSRTRTERKSGRAEFLFRYQRNKGKQGACVERIQAVVYLGPFKEVLDDDGHRMERGKRYAVCDKTYNLYKKAPYTAEFEFLDPLVEIPLAEAKPFDCSRTSLRHGSSMSPNRIIGDFRQNSSSRSNIVTAAGSRAWVARAITLVESRRADHRNLAQQLLVELLPHAGKARRVGITGVPGVGSLRVEPLLMAPPSTLVSASIGRCYGTCVLSRGMSLTATPGRRAARPPVREAGRH